MSESTEQQAIVYWFHAQYPDKIIFAIPNGSWIPVSNIKRRMAYTAKREREGLLPGVSDLFIPVRARCQGFTDIGNAGWETYGGLFVEMKNIGKTWSSVSPEQTAFIRDMQLAGYCAQWAAGFDVAKPIIEDYMRYAIL